MASSATLKLLLLGEDKASSAFNAAGKAADSAGKSTSKFGSFLSGVGKIAAGLGLAEGAKELGEWMIDGVKDAANFQKGMSALENTMKNLGVPADVRKEQEEYLTNLSNINGVAKTSLLPTYSQLFSSTKSVSKAQSEMQLALDMSAGSGQSLSKVVRALTSANGGTTTSLAKFGVTAKTTSGALAQLQKSYGGDSLKAQQTFGGMVDNLKNRLSNFQEELGQKALPYLNRFGAWFQSTGMPALKKFWAAAEPVLSNLVKAIATALRPALESMAKTFKNSVEPALQKFSTWMGNHQKQINQTAHVIGVVLGDAIKLVAFVLGNEVTVMVKGIAKLISAFQSIYKTAQTVKNNVATAFNNMHDFIAALPGRIRTSVENMFLTIVTQAANVKTGVVNHITSMLNWLGSVPGKISGLFKNIWSGLANSLVGEINSVLHLPLVIPSVNTHIPGVGTVGGETLIPALAKGGIVNSPTVALIGEAGPEAVVPLSQGGWHRSGAANAAGLGGGPTEIHIHLQGRTIVTEIAKYQRSKYGKASITV